MAGAGAEASEAQQQQSKSDSSLVVDTTSEQSDNGPTDFIDELLRGYQLLDMDPSRYANQVVLPAIVVFFSTIAIGFLLDLPPVRIVPLIALVFFGVIVAIIYPKLAKDNQKNEIEKQFHLFLTHITILSMADIDRLDVLRALATEEDYEALSDEVQIIVALVENWNLSLVEAAKTRAVKTPSQLMQDFFERMAYSLESGQSFEDFLMNEHEKIFATYTTRYESQMATLDTVKDLYLAVIMGTTFAMVFVIILPLLAGTNPTLLIGGVVFVYAIVQAGFAGLIHIVVPADPLWYVPEDHKTGIDARLRRAVSISVGVAGMLLILLILIRAGFTPIPAEILPIPFIPAIAGTPLLYPYIVGGTEETNIRRRDEEFPRFIRALGEIEGVRPTSTVSVLEELRDKEFGSLTEHVERLYRRMSLHMDGDESWHLFASEVGSYLVHKFSDMYSTGRSMGADPQQLAKIIGSNMMDVTSLREKRLQRASSMKGLIYGLLIVGVFAIFAGFEFTQIMVNVATLGGNSASSQFGGLLQGSLYDTVLITVLLTVLFVIGSFSAGVIIQLVQRGRLVTGAVHPVILMWASAVASFFSKYAARFIGTTVQ